MSATISVTTGSTGYTVVAAGGPGNPTDWVGLYKVSNHSGFLAWKYLNDTTTAPATGLTGGTLHFPISTETVPLEFRFYGPSNSAPIARGPVPVTAPPPGGSSTPDGYINVKDYGATGNPAGDDTAAMIAAANAAKATITSWGSKGLYFPPGGVYSATAPVDFLGISNIWCDGWLAAFGDIAGPVYKIGQPSNVGSGLYFIRGAYHINRAYDTMRHPLIRVQGMRGGEFRIGLCNSFIQVYAETGAYESTAYAEFHLGQTYRLELCSGEGGGATSGWINSNQFYGGTLAQLRVGGPWKDVTAIANNGSGVIRVTCAGHNYASGQMIELYRRTSAHASIFGLMNVIDANTFDIIGSTFAGPYTASEWMVMGPAGYPHNHNDFYNPDIEDTNAIIHMQGQCNRLLNCRMEVNGTSICAFGPNVFSNSVEQGNTEHGVPPATGAGIEMTVLDYSNGKNFTGWVRQPKGWGL